ncbi:hypothetical protein [Nonomuraea sp. NPDC046570]|uniref:hypothetical protein n=1 Tax=Nonomuraea sp. NPDC046570 TaxID=3155255 RepID=UPI0033F5212B
MIWLTFRQHRAQLVVTFGMLLVLGVMFLVSGLEAAGYIAEHAPAGCPSLALVCGDLNAALSDRYQMVYNVYGWLPIVAPALVGAFWGAPLLGREYERGTNRLVWTQSVPVGRWLAVKLGLIAAVVAAAGLLMSAMVSLWRPVFGRHDVFGNVGTFNMVGVAPAAWWLFAFVVGAAAGALLRRTLPAMAVVVAVVAIATMGLFKLSAYYAEPTRVDAREWRYTGDQRLLRNAWLDPAGNETEETPQGVCPRGTDVGRSSAEQDAFLRCLSGKGYRQIVYLHEPTQFWRFQLTEAALLLTTAGALGAVTVSRVLRRKA